jgi:hypothetical protein
LGDGAILSRGNAAEEGALDWRRKMIIFVRMQPFSTPDVDVAERRQDFKERRASTLGKLWS